MVEGGKAKIININIYSMGKFRDHTVEEIRRLRNARQKRKRQQRTAQRLALERAQIMKEREQERRIASELRETARKFCRKWREKCHENNKMRHLLDQYRLQVRFLASRDMHLSYQKYFTELQIGTWITEVTAHTSTLKTYFNDSKLAL